LKVPRASWYRHLGKQGKPDSKDPVRPAPPLALSEKEKVEVLEILHCERFQDQTPYEIYATLLDEGKNYCSIRTMYRLLKAEHGNNKDRRRQVSHQNYVKPELLAETPNQVWSWDITKLKGPEKWNYFQLYVMMDIFSRYIVGWLVAPCEQTALAKQLIKQSYDQQGVQPDQLTIHADRGSSMRSKGVAFLLADLGVTKTHNRPHVSNDNPYSESQFKTLKYCPEFPERFGSLENAKAFCRTFFSWYNKDHHHSGIALFTPEQVHYGQAEDMWEQRSMVLQQAFKQTPERFKGKIPIAESLPRAAWINKPLPQQQQ